MRDTATSWRARCAGCIAYTLLWLKQTVHNGRERGGEKKATLAVQFRRARDNLSLSARAPRPGTKILVTTVRHSAPNDALRLDVVDVAPLGSDTICLARCVIGRACHLRRERGRRDCLRLLA